MITIRKSEDRGVGRHGWLTTHHTFSFANYYDPSHMGFRDLRVINEDFIAAGEGFGSHHHDNMEIITLVMKGAVAHKDSTGGEGVIRRGEVQRMSAGTGVVHSEFNGSKTEDLHLFQIWIMPGKRGIKPGYEQKMFPLDDRRNKLQLLVAPGAKDGALDINTDARLYAAILDNGVSVRHEIESGRGAWIQAARGEITVNGTKLRQGDGASIENESSIEIVSGNDEAEILLFDLR